MSRDLFADTLVTRHAPKRSKWMIVGSVFAHVGVVAALLILPVLSALDNFVIHANDELAFVMPAASVPPTPPPPRAAEQPHAPELNARAAPLFAADKPVTGEATVTATGSGSTGPEAWALPVGRGEWPLPPGLGTMTLLAAPPKPQVPIRPGGDVKPPARIAYATPAYPTIARSTRIEGTVILEATIDELGVVRDVRVLRSIPLLDRAAIDAVSQWRYTPTRLNGMAVPILLTVTVTFTLR